MSEAEVRDLDLLEGAFYAGNPDPTYAWLRHHAPVYRDEVNALWGVSRYDDIVTMERHPEWFCSGQGYRPNLGADSSMIGRDDPRHLAQRRVIFQRFTPRNVRKLEENVRATVASLIDGFARRGRCDLVAEYAIPLPVITVLDLIGFDRKEWPRFAEIAEKTNAGGGGPRYLTDESMQLGGEFFQRFAELKAARERERADDLTSLMLDAHEDGSVQREDGEFGMEGILLLNGGSDTTRHVISTAAHALLQHPEQHALLRDEPSRIPTAVEEFIRWVTPILNMRRTATQDLELGGTAISEGDELLMMFSSANRDEAHFDEPERFDVTRNPNPHLAFGLGTHFCLGASLARLELRVAFEELLRRLPDLRIAPGFEPSIIPNAFVRGLESLEVEFTPEA